MERAFSGGTRPTTGQGSGIRARPLVGVRRRGSAKGAWQVQSPIGGRVVGSGDDTGASGSASSAAKPISQAGGSSRPLPHGSVHGLA
jgi:hypothetical protein